MDFLEVDLLSTILNIDAEEISSRVRYFETIYIIFLKDTNPDKKVIRLNNNDITTITNIADSIINSIDIFLGRNGISFKIDSILEIILLYYYIMEIICVGHSVDVLANYFGVDNFTIIFIKNLDLFSKPYFENINIREY